MPDFLYNDRENTEIFYGKKKNIEERAYGQERVSAVCAEDNSENK